jgi:uncharacterized protein YbjQ (UPF0145 family)
VSTLPRSEPFFADLSVSEFLLIGDGGWEPIDLVYGDCSYGVGDQVTSWRTSKALTWISDALTQGQTLALERMRQQAASVGAEGIVGVRLQTTDIRLDEDPENHPTQHFHAVGTAVRSQGGPYEQSQRPFTSHLSGQDTWSLSTAGCTPLGLVFGFGVYHAKTAFKRPDRCVEMPDLTAGIYDARTHAMHAMQAQAAELKANGVVGVKIELKMTPDRTVMFVATGTAISTRASGIGGPAPRLVLQLND